RLASFPTRRFSDLFLFKLSYFVLKFHDRDEWSWEIQRSQGIPWLPKPFLPFPSKVGNTQLVMVTGADHDGCHLWTGPQDLVSQSPLSPRICRPIGSTWVRARESSPRSCALCSPKALAVPWKRD